jgi:hypothetical protein
MCSAFCRQQRELADVELSRLSAEVEASAAAAADAQGQLAAAAAEAAKHKEAARTAQLKVGAQESLHSAVLPMLYICHRSAEMHFPGGVRAATEHPPTHSPVTHKILQQSNASLFSTYTITCIALSTG